MDLRWNRPAAPVLVLSRLALALGVLVGGCTPAPKAVEPQELYFSVDFRKVLSETHSLAQSRQMRPGIFAFFNGEHPYGLDGGNEAATLSEEQQAIIAKGPSEAGIIDLGDLGTFVKVDGSETGLEPDRYLLSTIFPRRHYSDETFDLVLEGDTVRINGEDYGLLTNLGFQREPLDVLSKENGAYYVEITETVVRLYQTTPDDFSFGKRGPLIAELAADGETR